MNPQRKTVFRDILDVLCFAKTLRKTLVNSVEKFVRFAPPPSLPPPPAGGPPLRPMTQLRACIFHHLHVLMNQQIIMLILIILI